MRGLDWYARSPRKALDGMRHLTLEQRGAYDTLLDLIYERGGPVPDDDRWLSGWMGVSPRRWRQIRQELLDLGRIVAKGSGRDAVLSDEKAEIELSEAEKRRAQKAAAGAKGGQNSGKSRRNSENRLENVVEQNVETPKNNDLAEASAQAKRSTVTDTYTPIVPKGTLEAVERIWSKVPKTSRERSSKADLKKALDAAVKRGCDLAQIEAGLGAYFASEDATRDGGRFVKGVHRLVQGDRWSSHAPSDEGLFAEPQITEADARRLAWTKNRYWNPDWGVRPDREVTS